MQNNIKTKIFFFLIIFFGLFGLVQGSQAANHYVRSGASGSATGNDWTSAYTSLPSTLTRGDTYYIAGGSYAGKTFNTAASGTSVITIKGATVADHGIDTGWSNNYSVENTQATWTSGIIFNTSYWVFDGSVGPMWSKTASQYGFAFSAVQFPISIYNSSTAFSNITVSHIAATAPTGDIASGFIITSTETQSINNVTISHCYGSGWENFMWATSPGIALNNWILEYNVSLNGYSSAAWHGEDFNNNSSILNLTVRYNWLEGRTGGTACIVALNATPGPYYIYGNVFKDMRYGDGCITGIINGYGTQTMSGVVYNNTFINVQSAFNYGAWIGTAVTSNVQNNLCYNMRADLSSGPPHDYNAYFSTTNTPSETHGQISSGNPFTNYTAGDVSLVASTNAGINLPSPYNIDAFGHVRGADGVWDRGAIEYGTGGGADTTAPSAPSGLSVN